MSARRPYIRSMSGWWRKNPWFIEYMVHEGTALFVALYALILLAGVYMLGNGEASWNRWREFLASPLSIAIHVVVLIAFLYHAWTWFNIMPRTLPPLVVKGERIKAATIVRTGLIAAALSSLIVFAIACGFAS